MNLVLLYPHINLPTKPLQEIDIWEDLVHVNYTANRQVQDVFNREYSSNFHQSFGYRTEYEFELIFDAIYLTPDKHMIISNLDANDLDFIHLGHRFRIYKPMMKSVEMGYDCLSLNYNSESRFIKVKIISYNVCIE